MLIRSIRPRNLLSFGPDTEALPLGPLNVLIGANGSGKSNFLEAFGLLQAAPTELAVPIRQGRGVADWIWQGESKASSASIEALAPTRGGEELRYILEFGESDRRLAIVLEELWLSSEPDCPLLHSDGTHAAVRPVAAAAFEKGFELEDRRMGGEADLTWRDVITQDVEPTGSALAQIKDANRYPELTAWGQSLARISLHRQWHFGIDNPVRHLQRTDLPNGKLMEDCSNLGLVLNRLAQDFDVKQRLVAALRDLYEDVVDFHVSVEFSTVQVFLVECGGKVTLPATRLSDGTIRYLCLLAILCHPDPPPLVCIEEPELGLHPDLIGRLANLLREASERCQLIVTTHSDGLVDALTDIPESVVVCDKEEGSTKLRRLDRKDLGHWLERYRLGELWSSGELGGNRW